MEPKSDVPPAAPAEDNAWKAPGTSTSNGEAAPWASMLTVATAPESGHVAPFSDGGDVKRFPRTQSGSSAASPMHEFDTGPPAWSNSEFGSAASLTSPFDPSARTWASSSHSHLSRASSIHTSASTPAGKPDDAGSPLDAPQALSSNGGSYVDAAAVAGAPSSAGHPTPTSAAPAAATAGHPPGYAPLTSQVWGQPSVSTHRGVPTRWGAPDESRVSGSTSSRSSGSGSNASSTRWSSDTPNSSSTPTPHNGRPPVVPEATTWTPHGHDGSDGRPARAGVVWRPGRFRRCEWWCESPRRRRPRCVVGYVREQRCPTRQLGRRGFQQRRRDRPDLLPRSAGSDALVAATTCCRDGCTWPWIRRRHGCSGSAPAPAPAVVVRRWTGSRPRRVPRQWQ